MLSSSLKREVRKSFEGGLLAFDVDGVVADTMSTFLDIVADVLGGPRLSLDDITAYSLKDCLPLPDHMVERGVAMVQEMEYTLKTPHFPGARKVLRAMARKSPVNFVTARTEAGPLTEWLKNLLEDAPLENILVAAVGSASAKPSHLTGLGVRFFVEDRLDTCEALQEMGIVPIVFDQPWNLAPHPYPRVSSWEEIARLLGVT